MGGESIGVVDGRRLETRPGLTMDSPVSDNYRAAFCNLFLSEKKTSWITHSPLPAGLVRTQSETGAPTGSLRSKQNSSRQKNIGEIYYGFCFVSHGHKCVTFKQLHSGKLSEKSSKYLFKKLGT